MFCPGCNRYLKTVPKNHHNISDSKEHLWGICPNCKEFIHFVYTPQNNQVYGWLEKQEEKYKLQVSALSNKKNILYISEFPNPKAIIRLCREFIYEHNWNAGFIITEEYYDVARILSAVHSVVILPQVLFPEKPSFIAEKIIIETLAGKLFSVNSTFNNCFEVWKND